MAPPNVNAALKRVRESLTPKVTQAQLAEKTGIRQTQISRFENEHAGSEPSLDQLAALEDAMGVERGTVLTVAGYIREAATADRVLFTDPTLEPELVDVVLDAYRAAQRASAKLRAQRVPRERPARPDGPGSRGRQTAR